MKLSELLNALEGADPDAEVILQKDAEGNGYSPLCYADRDAVYIPDSSCSGDVYSLSWRAEDAAMDEEEWESVKLMPRCIVLVPMN